MEDPILYDIFKAIAALAFVIGLMGGLVFLLKKFGISNIPSVQSGEKRLKIVESLPLDARRRLVLIQRDDQQHLVILSVSGETIVETNIESKPHNDST